VPNEVARADVVEFVGVAVVTILDLRKRAVTFSIDQEFVSARQQRVAVAAGERPGQGVADLEIKRDPEIGIEVPLDVELGAVGDRKFNPAVGHLLDQASDFDIGIFDPAQIGIDFAQRGEHIDVTGTGNDLDGSADDITDGLGLAGSELVNEVHVDRLIRVTEIQELAP
jgi:hypothetical protein